MTKSVNKKAEYLKNKIAQKYKLPRGENPLTASWYFEKWYEKIILIGAFVLAVWKIIGFIK